MSPPHPIAIPAPNAIPPALLNKDLPPTPQPERVSDLELENAILRKEIAILRIRVDLHYRQTANSLKLLADEIASSLQGLQNAALAMKNMEKRELGKVEALLENYEEAFRAV